jgi:hypothetical protein
MEKNKTVQTMRSSSKRRESPVSICKRLPKTIRTTATLKSKGDGVFGSLRSDTITSVKVNAPCEEIRMKFMSGRCGLA